MEKVWTNPSISIIQQAVCDHFRMKMSVLLGKNRNRHLARPRQLAMYLCYKLLETSLSELGIAFERDHTTVQYGINKMTELLKSNHAMISAHNYIKYNIKLPELPSLAE